MTALIPEAKAEAQIFVNVTRNVNGPQFQPSATYEKVIVDSFGVGEEVLRVRATDGDQTVGIPFYQLKQVVINRTNLRYHLCNDVLNHVETLKFL